MTQILIKPMLKFDEVPVVGEKSKVKFLAVCEQDISFNVTFRDETDDKQLLSNDLIITREIPRLQAWVI